MKKKYMAGVTFASVMKWVGVAAALISFGTTLYELANSEGELRERKRVVAEQLLSGRAQQASGDYDSAWSSFALASTTAATDGFFAKLLGDLSSQRQQIRMAQEDLAMQWVRGLRVAEGHEFSEVVDKLVGVLTAGATAPNSQPARKADLLAHLGWAYFLKLRGGDTSLKPDTPYREAVAADPTNPYANAFWGHWILWNRGSLGDANAHFAAALASNRARADVRHFQISALANSRTDEAEVAWWKVIDEMHKGNEDPEPALSSDLYNKYYIALNNDSQRQLLLSAIPAAGHVELLKNLLQSPSLEKPREWILTAMLASMEEAAGQPAESLATWRALLAQIRSEPDSTLTPRANAAIKRLSATDPAHR